MWEIIFLNEVVLAEFLALPVSARAKFDRIEELIRSCGLENLDRPYVAHVTGKIWEIRIATKDSNARCLYVTRVGRKIVLLRVFDKKTDKIPRREIEIAMDRLTHLRTGR